jgi:hypothetical protein
MGLTQEDIDQLSPHLFWDVNRKDCKWELHKKFIVQRVLEYGLIDDWYILTRKISVKEIGKIALQIRDLSPKSLAFISTLSHIPEEKFRCYTLKQLIPQYWNF